MSEDDVVLYAALHLLGYEPRRNSVEHRIIVVYRERSESGMGVAFRTAHGNWHVAHEGLWRMLPVGASIVEYLQHQEINRG